MNEKIKTKRRERMKIDKFISTKLVFNNIKKIL